MVARKGGETPTKGLGTPWKGCCSKGSGPRRHLFLWNKCYEPLIPGFCQDQLSVKAVVEEPGLVKQCKCMREKGVSLAIARHDLLCVHRMAPMEDPFGNTMHIDGRVGCRNEEQVHEEATRASFYKKT